MILVDSIKTKFLGLAVSKEKEVVGGGGEEEEEEEEDEEDWPVTSPRIRILIILCKKYTKALE